MWRRACRQLLRIHWHLAHSISLKVTSTWKNRNRGRGCDNRRRSCRSPRARTAAAVVGADEALPLTAAWGSVAVAVFLAALTRSHIAARANTRLAWETGASTACVDTLAQPRLVVIISINATLTEARRVAFSGIPARMGILTDRLGNNSGCVDADVINRDWGSAHVGNDEGAEDELEHGSSCVLSQTKPLKSSNIHHVCILIVSGYFRQLFTCDRDSALFREYD